MKSSSLSDKSLVIVFAYAPAGLGHLRVTDALYHGLPTDSFPYLLGSQDTKISLIHRLISIHPFARSVMELAQKEGLPEDVFIYFYKKFLKSRTHLLYQQIVTILDERFDPPTTLLLVATHFGLAHQLASIKQKISNEKHVQVFWLYK